MLREGTMPVVKLSLCTMMLKMVPRTAPVSRARNCTCQHTPSGLPCTLVNRTKPNLRTALPWQPQMAIRGQLPSDAGQLSRR